jgi:hypothetical protein
LYLKRKIDSRETCALTIVQIQEDLAYYRGLEKALREKIEKSPAKSYSLSSGGGSRTAASFDVEELVKVRKIIAELENQEAALLNGGSIIAVGAGW